MFFFAATIVSCTSSGPALFGRQSPHEQYGNKLSSSGLKETTMGSLWFAEADYALTHPISITLPFKQVGYFAAEKPRAVGVQFSGRRGEKLIFQLNKNSRRGMTIYGELWSRKEGGKQELLFSFDSTKNRFTHVVEKEETYLVRLQPGLLESGEYTFSISVGPSLGFPVAGGAAKIGSVWGDTRNAGARRHEGIDIFAPKRTPAVASESGTVSRVEETDIGGKVVWLRAFNPNVSLYYAHLDEQLVQVGKTVKRGDTLGLVGNTGNAKTTPPHLHFGIYGLGGAVNPLPFVNQIVQEAPELMAKSATINRYYRTTKDLTFDKSEDLKKSTPVFIADVSSLFAIAKAPNGKSYKIDQTALQLIDKQLITIKSKDSSALLEDPISGAPIVKRLPPETSFRVLGIWNEYRFVETPDKTKGWLLKPSS